MMTEPIEYKIKDYTEARGAINQMIGSFERLWVVAKKCDERYIHRKPRETFLWNAFRY